MTNTPENELLFRHCAEGGAIAQLSPDRYRPQEIKSILTSGQDALASLNRVVLFKPVDLGLAVLRPKIHWFKSIPHTTFTVGQRF
jgi:hypothetical protein